jgi:hypothetical protein
MPVELDPPCETKCATVDGQQGVLTIRKWGFQIDVDDDRAPRPQTPRFVEVCSGSVEWLEPDVEDCSGQRVPFYVAGPPVDATEGVDFTACPEGQICPEGESVCRLGEATSASINFYAEQERIQVGDCTYLGWEVTGATEVLLDGDPVGLIGSTPVCPTQTTEYALQAEGPGGGWVTKRATVEVTAAETAGAPVIRFWLGGVERDSVLVPSVSPCFTLKWDVQNATTVYLDREHVGDSGERSLCVDDQVTTYTFVAEGPGGRDEESFTVEKFSSQ